MPEMSQNGWSVLPADGLKYWHLPGFSTPMPLRSGPAGFIMAHWSLCFHELVERLSINYDDWGWAPRRIPATGEWSNHASGTAVDLNAQMHPYGATGTFTDNQLEILETRLARTYAPVIRWGGHYRVTQDEMHFEINLPPDDLMIQDLATQLHRSKRGKRLMELNRHGSQL